MSPLLVLNLEVLYEGDVRRQHEGGVLPVPYADPPPLPLGVVPRAVALRRRVHLAPLQEGAHHVAVVLVAEVEVLLRGEIQMEMCYELHVCGIVRVGGAQ